jgi:hypothetical protein
VGIETAEMQQPRLLVIRISCSGGETEEAAIGLGAGRRGGDAATMR